MTYKVRIRQRKGRAAIETEVSFKGIESQRESGERGGRVWKVVDPGVVGRIMASRSCHVLTP